jgi:uncharacterized phage protein (TIGR02218 family)
MKNLSPALKTHFASEMTNVATCWLLTRRDGVNLGFTDSAQDLVISFTDDTGQSFNNITYKASTGFTPTAVVTSDDFAVDNLDVQAMLDSDTLDAGDLEGGKYDYAAIRIFQVNYSSLSQGVMFLRRGWIGQVTLKRGQFIAEVQGLMRALQQVIGRLYTPPCDADFGDSRCTFNKATVTVTGTVTSVTSNSIFTDTSRLEADNWFTYGLLTWSTGNNAGLKMEVKAFASGLFTLFQSMPYTIQVGDTYSVYAGCDKSPGTCKAKFNNYVNFQGFPDVPGQDSVLAHK